MQGDFSLLRKRFSDLCQIPRRSKNEAVVRAYIRNYAERQGFGFQEDTYGNCVVSVPGRGQGKTADAVLLQSHSDMVCVADETAAQHDFARDPIHTREVAWTDKETGVTKAVLMAAGTTLGADNGIGLAASLAVATDPALTDCPPLELLVTVEEEIGLDGARQLDPALLRADLLINLDTEALGEICISCAGGRNMTVSWPLVRSAASPNEVPVRIFLAGLPGGHSGIEIHERRGNAIVMLLNELLSQRNRLDTLRLASLSGGTAHNVIPGEAEIVVWLPQSQAAQLVATLNDSTWKTRVQDAIIESGREKVACGAEAMERATAQEPISSEQTRAILQAIAGVPYGVQAWSEVVPNLVETSNNVAVVSTVSQELTLICSTRSSKDSAIRTFQEAVAPTLKASGGTVTFGQGYPGWPADASNILLAQAEKTFSRILGVAPKVIAVHAGLECGVFKGKRPALQMISFGPTIREPHTPRERVELDSIPPFYHCLTQLLQDLVSVAK